MVANPHSAHLDLIAKALADGRVVPFLGAGASLCGRPEGATFKKGQYLPSGSELTEHLARQFAYPDGEAKDLLRVSQYGYVMLGSGPLYQELHDLLNEDYPVTPLHELLARMPADQRIDFMLIDPVKLTPVSNVVTVTNGGSYPAGGLLRKQVAVSGSSFLVYYNMTFHTTTKPGSAVFTCHKTPSEDASVRDAESDL